MTCSRATVSADGVRKSRASKRFAIKFSHPCGSIPNTRHRELTNLILGLTPLVEAKKRGSEFKRGESLAK